MEFFVEVDDALMERCRRKGGILRDYLGYLHRRGLTTPLEESLIGTPGAEFINLIETTSMNRLYKMPLLSSFIRGDHMVLHAGWDDIARSFRGFYSNGSNRVDIRGLKHFEGYDEVPDPKWVSLARENPIRFLVRGSPRFFREDDDGFHLSDGLAHYVEQRFFTEHVRDAIGYRVADFKRARYMNRE